MEYPIPAYSLVGDFGDAPDSQQGTGAFDYKTLLVDNGPVHGVGSGLFLGETVSIDESVELSTDADSDDDDGMVNPDRDLNVTGVPSFELLVTNENGAEATLYGWLDVNFDGVFDESERVEAPISSRESLVTLTFPELPAGLTATTYARFRLSTDDDAASLPTGYARDGEVEDYRVTIHTPTSRGAEKVDAILGQTEFRVGASIAWLGDLDGNGFDDYAVGSSQRNHLSILLMATDTLVGQEVQHSSPNLDRWDSFGGSVTSIGDLDNDGVTDIAVGARGERGLTGEDTGAVHILFLNSDGTEKRRSVLTDGTAGIPDLAKDDWFGYSVAAIGDVNGDTIMDLAVGASYDSQLAARGGAVYVLMMNRDGSVQSTSKIAHQTGGGPSLQTFGYFGSSIAALGNWNDDDIPDLAIAAREENVVIDGVSTADVGVVYLFTLNQDGTASGYTKIDAVAAGLDFDADDYFGWSLANLGDIDSNGANDLAVGAVGDDTGGRDHGAVHLLLMNEDGTVKETATIAELFNGGPDFINSETDRAYFGSAIATLPDRNDDGLPELAIGAYLARPSGQVYITHLTEEFHDFGDALVSVDAEITDYPEATSNLPPSHLRAPDVFLGAAVDFEPRLLPDLNASSDDISFPINDANGLLDPAQLSSFVAGEPITVDVLATNLSDTTATVYGWIDLNGNKLFDIGERNRLLDNQRQPLATVAPGAIGMKVSLTFDAPSSVVEGDTYARFRISTDPAAAAPTGHATDGEVEDYTTSITIIDTDYGDAPDNYKTLSTSNGPSHMVDPLIYLGSGVDQEAEAAPTTNANGDQDDGLVDASTELNLIPGQVPTVRVQVTNGTTSVAQLFGWIDYDNNGVFQTDPNDEQASIEIPAGYSGTVELTFPAVPETAVGVTYARFRFSTDTAASSPTGPAADGEVEDYRVTILANDYGDAPAIYHQTEGGVTDAPSHKVVEGLSIGTIVDREASGIYTSAASSDNTRIGQADEDGLSGSANLLSLTAGQPIEFEVDITNTDGLPAKLQVWLDLDFSGTFTESERREFDALQTGPVLVTGYGTIPADVNGFTYARFRLSTDHTADELPTGHKTDGEVEDYYVSISNRDYGDAPDTGKTPSKGNYSTIDGRGPVHTIVPGLYMGDGVDGEDNSLQRLPDRRQRVSANGDDESGATPDDEDGVVDPSASLRLQPGEPAAVTVLVTNKTGADAYLVGWIDWDMDGDFENNNYVSETVKSDNEEQPIPLLLESDGAPIEGTTYARFRLTTDPSFQEIPSSVGTAIDGEVEDYVVTISAPNDDVVLPELENSIRAGYKIASGTTNLGFLSSGDAFGTSVASGDWNGDDVLDFAVGAPYDDTGGSNRGAVHLLLMNSDGSIQEDLKIASGTNNLSPLENGDYFGSSLTAGDWNGDGVLDLAVGARYDNTGGYGRGAVHVLLMGSDGNIQEDLKIASGTNNLSPLNNYDYFGSSLTAGDWNGDDVLDLAVGAYGDNTGGITGGAVHVLLMNSAGSIQEDLKIASGTNNLSPLNDYDSFGSSLTAGDWNRDGVLDLAVGAIGDNTGGWDRGAAHLLLMNSDGNIQEDLKIASGTKNLSPLEYSDYFGSSLTAGDWNGDGVLDVVVGAHNDKTDGFAHGAVHVLVLGNFASPETIGDLVQTLPPIPPESGYQFEGEVDEVTLDDWLTAIETLPEFPRPNETVNITLYVAPNATDYSGQEVVVPNGYQLVINSDESTITFTGASPALTVVSGDVVVSGNVRFVNPTNTPTIKVLGGSLTLRGVTIDESTGGDQPAIEVLGGTVDLGTVTDPGDNTININGGGDLIHNSGSGIITAVGNTFQQDGADIAYGFAVQEEIQDYFETAASGAVLVYDDRYFDRTKTRVSDFDLQKLTADLELSEPSFEILGNVAGTATLLPDNQTVRFTADSSGLSSFTFAVIEDNATQAIRTIELDVTNVPPTAFDVQGVVTEDGPVVDLTADYEDADVSDVHTVSIDATETTGTVTNNGDGTFTYDPAGKFETLAENASATDSFQYTVDDGNGGTSTATITVAVNGQNDAASISGTAVGETDEDSAATISGVLSVADVDSGEAGFDPTTQTGTYGSFAIDAFGNWNYGLDNEAAQHLNAGDFATDSFIVTSVDGTASETVVLTIEGLNDQATISGNAVGQIDEDSLIDVSGSLLITDIDEDENQFVPLAESVGNFGTFSVNATGDWTYVLVNASVQGLSVDEVGTESFVVLSLDGTATETVTVTITGQNDAPQINLELDAVSVSEGMTAENSGTFADVDLGDTVSLTSSVGAVTEHGDGTWSWSLETEDSDQSGEVTITATDGLGASASTSFALDVGNEAPELLGITPSLVGDDRSMNLGGLFSDAGRLDSHTIIIDWGEMHDSAENAADDRTIIELAAEDAKAFSVDHTFASGGVFTISVSIVDDNSGEVSASTQVRVSGVRLDPNTHQLQVIGTDENDYGTIAGWGNQLIVAADFLPSSRWWMPFGVQRFSADEVESILVETGDGNDVFAALNNVVQPSTLHGGAGNDVLTGGGGPSLMFGGHGNDRLFGGSGDDIIRGESGNDRIFGNAGDDLLLGGEGDDRLDGGRDDDILVGGDGNDDLDGDRGRDVLFGGLGADDLNGGKGDDLLIAGWTQYDENQVALNTIRDVWNRDQTYQERISALGTGVDSPDGSLVILSDQGDNATVYDDEEEDRLKGLHGSDWFFADLANDRLLGRKRWEQVGSIGQ